MASRANKARSTKSIIPIYVNLKELDRQDGIPIDRNLIKSFILKSLQRINDRDIDKFLDDEFDLGVKNGTWFFLFDSFDEIPEVLSSTEADTIIRSYGEAIYDFLHGLNQCRGIVASRQFRGPTYFGWPRFRVLSLSERRRLELIKKAGLDHKLESELIGNLATANENIRLMAGNPLFLNLLCEHMKSGYHFPENAHIVFENYIGYRLIRDEGRLQQRFKLRATDLRAVAENIAFCIATDLGLGLSPTRTTLKIAMECLSMKVEGNFDTILDALEYIKLARSEAGPEAIQSRTFTFAHRRFQEYFATCVVLQEPSRVSSDQLLTDMRWRETAVVMCQTQPIEVLSPILEKIHQLVEQFCSNTPDLIDTPIQYVLSKDQSTANTLQPIRDSFPWPTGSLHMLSLIQEGFANRLMDLPDYIRVSLAKLVLTAFEMGRLPDKKLALEISGTVPEIILVYLLKNAFSSESQWLREVAYRQTSRLSTISPEIAQGIRNAIVDLAGAGRLQREKSATKAHLERLNRSTNFLSSMRLLIWLPILDTSFYIVLYIVILFGIRQLIFSFPIIMLPLIVFTFYMAQVMGSVKNLIKYFRDLSLLPMKSKSKLGLILEKGGGYFSYPFYLMFTRGLVFILMLLIFFSWQPNRLVIDENIYHLYIPLGLIATYFVLFGPFGIWAAQTGNFTKPLWWVILPIWPLLYPLLNPHSIVTFIQREDRRTKVIQAFLSIFALLLAIIISASGFVLAVVVISLNKITALILAYVLAGVVIIAPLYIALQACFWLQDRLRWYVWKWSQQEIMTCQEMFKLIRLYHDERHFSIRMIKAVREQQLLDVTEETEALLRGTARAIEEKLLKERYNKRKGKITWQMNKFWVKNNKNKNDQEEIISKANPELLDELYKFLDYILDKINL
jgi:hypothetical protein